jgi:NTP pyrophosphatase (non-canonical NTP hydrolase)
MRTNQQLVSFLIRKWEDAGEFVIPSFLKAITFIVTEVGELFDAWLRTMADDGFVRNHGEKDVDPAEELADIVLMAYVAADALGIDLDEELHKKLGKMDKKKMVSWLDKAQADE